MKDARPPSGRPAALPRTAPSGPQADSKRERARLLSLALIALIKRKVTELTGLGLVLAGGLLGAMLASYSPGDPSFNTIKGAGGDSPVHNLIGVPGAYVADLITQTIGFAGFLAVAAFTVWGIRLALLIGLSRPVWRGAMLALAMLFAAVALAALPPVTVPGLYRDYPGGSLGLILFDRLSATRWAMPALVVSGLASLLLFAGALGLPVLGCFRLGAALRRLPAAFGQAGPKPVRRPGEGRPPPRPPGFGSRGEPSFGGAAGAPPPGYGHADDALAGEVEDDAEEMAPPPPRHPEPAVARKGQPVSPLAEDAAYQLPPLDLLRPAPPGSRTAQLSEDEMRRHAGGLTGVLADFGVRGEIKSYRPGPVVTLYELEPAPGTKSSRVIGLADDLARSMSAVSVRVAVVPGRNVIGIELPNPKRETVWLRELLEADAYARTAARLALVLGKDIGGAPVIADLARMPHLLIAGTTGSGKSVGINTMILSLLYRMTPDQCKFIMVDPKMLELSVYDGIPHLLAPVVTDPKRAVVALKWTVREMEDRYRNMSKLGVRNIEGYNARLREAREAGTPLSRRVQTGFDPDTGKPIFEEQPLDLKDLPYIVVVVDEMADLMLVAGKDIEAAIQRLAQMARAAGIHLIMATQRPSVDVITGTIKANFPTRISFQVTSKIDSRTILGEQGAEQLLGQGDMLYMAGGGRITRVHGPFVADEEVERVVQTLKAQGEPSYIDAVTEDSEADDDGDERPSSSPGTGGGGGGNSEDELYDKAVALVARERKASTSYVQRFLRIGYNSAARLIERMEKEGVISKPNVAGKREVLARKPEDDGR
ncbi:MAG: DNA translocase FtsK 4TM domain-containing protein [Rhodospirillaceae bacterium]